MDFVKEFISTYGLDILNTILIGLAGLIGAAIKKVYNRYVDTKIKKDIAKTCVVAVEQLYKNLHGEEKYEKCLESMAEMLTEKGISVTDLECKMLIESAVGEFNSVFFQDEEQDASDKA